ncbi:MAG: TonB family protein [Vicinamibacterales bacterium]
MSRALTVLVGTLITATAVWFAAAALPAGVIRALSGSEARLARTNELNFRSRAVHTPRPVLTTVPRSASAGVVVVEVTTDTDGAVENVTMLEAPDRAIAKAVESAVARWSFQPLEVDGQKLRQTGKLTFYFVPGGGRWLVRNPAEMPGFVPPREGQYTNDASPS